MTELVPLGATLRIVRPAPNVMAFYDGRVAGKRAEAVTSNWVDDGAYALGVCTYAIVDGDEAIVYDTHISLPHARLIRAALEQAGVRHIRVVLSHWHLDHVAGNAVFADCEIIAHTWTLETLQRHRAAIEAGTLDGPPGIRPLVLPTTTFDDTLELRVGRIPVSLRHVDIHSRDGAMLVLPEQRLLLAGDALEDTVTYVSEPEGFANHLRDLARMQAWEIDRILPNHGALDRIELGGYGKSFITAAERYLQRLLESRADDRLRSQSLPEFVAGEIAQGWISYFEPYEAVHRENVGKAVST